MQTILGANGQIAQELAKELKRNYTSDLRLVSRNPKKVNDTDQLFPANLLDKTQAETAIQGSEIVYFAVGLPMDSEMWEQQFPLMMRNVIDACKKYQAKLVFFDNTYMYPQNNQPLTEQTAFAPVGRKGKVRAEIANMLLKEMQAKTITAVICRAPEFYGPDHTQSITNSLIFDNLKQGKKLKVFLNDNTLRSLIWTPDASKAMALIGNTPDAYGQTWHLPTDDHRLTSKQFIALTSELYSKPLSYSVIPKWALTIAKFFSPQAKEVQELLPRYAKDNLFISDKFKQRFPQFKVTTYRQGIEQILKEQQQ